MTGLQQESIKGQANVFDLPEEQENTALLLRRLLGKSVADRYVDFCRLSAGAFDLRVASPLAGHALRELDSILRRTLGVPFQAIATPSEGEDARRTAAINLLEKLGYDEETIERAGEALRPRANHKDQIRTIATSLGLAPDGDIAKSWIAISSAHKKAHERPFHRSLEIDDEFRNEWAEPFHVVVRGIAVALQGKYTTLMGRVEELAAMPDRGRAVSLFEKEIPGALPLQWHFFRKIQGASWLPELLKRGLVKEPFGYVAGEKEEAGLRQWPVGHYLLEMAKSDDCATRAIVVYALRELADATHPDVRRSGLEIISALPAQEIASVVDLAAAWLGSEGYFFGTHIAEQILTRLAEANEPAACLKLASELYRVAEMDGELVTHFSPHMYEHSIFKLTPVLTRVAGLGSLKLLCDLLHQAATITNKIRTDPRADYTTYSSFSLPVTEADQHDVYGSLVAAVLRCSTNLIEDTKTDGNAIMRLLQERPYRVYRRITLQALARRPQAVPSTAEALLCDDEFLESGNYAQEYAELALAWFPSMDPTKQQELLAKIDAVPKKYLAAWKERFFAHYKRQPDTAEEQNYVDLTIRDLTWYWRDVLPADRRNKLEECVSRNGDPEAWQRSMMGAEEESPLGPDSFATMGAEQVAEYLKHWEPDPTLPKHTRTALAFELRKAAEADALKYSSAAPAFAEAAPIYVRRLLEALQAAVRNNISIDWARTLKLVEATLDRVQSGVQENAFEDGDDPTFFWAAKEGAELLRTGLQKGAESLGTEHIQQVRFVVRAMEGIAPDKPELEDFETRYARNAYYGSETTMFGLVTEINFLIVYWLSKHEGSAVAQSPRKAIALSAEFREFAERALEQQDQNGRIVRAILGRYLSWLIYFGDDWVRQNFNKIFPSTPTLREAAWLGHLLNDNRPARDFVQQMRSIYEDEFTRIKTNAAKEDRDFRQERCCDYVLILYLWGVLPDDLLNDFLLSAPPRLRRHAISFVGRELRAVDMAEAVRARALGYWEMRLAAAMASSNKDDFREELSPIGIWNTIAQVDPIWLLDQQTKMFRAGFAPSDAFGVVDWASTIVAEHPDKTVEMVEALIANPKTDRWAYMANQNSIRTILTAGLASKCGSTQERVQRIISYLATVGDFAFMDLVKK